LVVINEKLGADWIYEIGVCYMTKKITMSTDWHFGKSNGKFDDVILEGIKAQCQHAKKNGVAIIINLGDTLDVKQPQ
jgi:hypothetical protein